MRTYISLFSSAGVGCYGFKQNGFECVATNELFEPRIAVQKANHKCKYDSGYICGDATSQETHNKIFAEIDKWKQKEGIDHIDVVFATPPCQGMSTANYKKNDHEQIRNSLVVQAIKMVMEIRPNVFVFENVRAFMKSICTDVSGKDMTIKESIYGNLSKDYNIFWKVINFKDYGVPSSRPRTIVIGTKKSLKSICPLHLFPTRCQEILLKDSIGPFKRLKFGEKDPIDPFHFARPFPKYMLDWIKDLKEGETAFDNADETKPCQFDKDGNRIINKGAYMGNKYRRLIWNRPGACIATRSDVMSSQDTIHPCDNRVLSIRELMTLMTIPNSFKWTDSDDKLTVANSEEYLKENEGNIRRCIGEAVPTHIAYDIASKISRMLDIEEKTSKHNSANNHLQKLFDSIVSLNDSCNTLRVKFISLVDFEMIGPLLASFYSHIEKINIDIVGLSSDDEANAINTINAIHLGSNVIISINPKLSKGHDYDIIIEGGICKACSSKTMAEEEVIQLQLF
jgi:DNA (cytosine-5)-methyltransferase 1